MPVLLKSDFTDGICKVYHYRLSPLFHIQWMIVEKSQYFWKIKFLISFLKLLMHFRFLISIGTPFHSLAPVYFMDFLPRVVFAFGVCKFCICLVSCECISLFSIKYLSKTLGCRGTALSWFKSYLSSRKQYTKINETISSIKEINCGVQQGSVLGPLLFLIYTNDIQYCIHEDKKLRLFADDTNVFLRSNSPDNLKSQLVTTCMNLFEWFSSNKLSANEAKTAYTIFKKQRAETPDELKQIEINTPPSNTPNIQNTLESS